MNVKLDGIALMLIIIFSLSPDLIDLIFFNKRSFHTYHRVITHSLFGIFILYLLALFQPFFYMVLLGVTLHLFEDFLGGGPIYILPFYGKIILLDEETIKKLGLVIKPYIAVFVEETEYLPIEFVWFYLLIMTGSVTLAVGLIIYLM